MAFQKKRKQLIDLTANTTTGLHGDDIFIEQGASPNTIKEEIATKATLVPTPTENAIVTQTASGDIQDSGTLISALQAVSAKDQNSGYAGLSAGGKLDINQIPDSIKGGLIYQGTWNASTNTPTLVSGTGTTGHYYIVSVAGNTVIDGHTDWQIGDWIAFNGTTWDKIDNSDRVSSVNGQTGVVVLDTEDIAESGDNVYYTAARSALNEKVANKGAVSGYCPLDASQKVPTANLPTITANVETYSHKVTAAEITAKKIDFAAISRNLPSSANDFKADFANGSLEDTTDYALTGVSNAEFNWTGKVIDGIIAENDVIGFAYSY